MRERTTGETAETDRPTHEAETAERVPAAETEADSDSGIPSNSVTDSDPNGPPESERQPSDDDSGWLGPVSGEKLRRAGRIAATLLVVAVVIPFVVVAVPQLVGAQYSFVVLSGSMEPAISPGDVVLVADTDPSTVESGDVITYQRSDEGTPTTHRVVSVEGSGDDRQFRTQGDANDNVDSAPVNADQYIGHVIGTIPLVGYMIAFVNTPLGFAALVVLPIAAFVLSEAWAIYAGRSGKDGDRDGGRSATDHELAPEEASPGAATKTEKRSVEMAATDRATSDDVGADLESEAETAADAGADGYQLTAIDLTISPILLAALAGYSGWVTYTSYLRTGVPDMVSVVVVTASTTSLALVLAARSQLPSEPPSSPESEPETSESTMGAQDDPQTRTAEESRSNGSTSIASNTSRAARSSQFDWAEEQIPVGSENPDAAVDWDVELDSWDADCVETGGEVRDE
ncbi:signal peptidase I [Halosolutus amylolyticus]|uniref:Signal peptidase I n=1 Tax=Halosolutus amylolyticus TaxID=2932267 RepID=A0ABD5PW92_9EURY|nr:signal peptidase I [Halosolutus amylolyticus]